MSILNLNEEEIKKIMSDEKREVKEVIFMEVKETEKKKRGRPKKIKNEIEKKPVGRPKSKNDIKTRRLLYGLTFFGKLLGVSDDILESKKKELSNNGLIIDTPGKDSEKNIIV